MIATKSKVWLSIVLGAMVLLGASATANAQHYRYRYYHHGYGHGYGHRYGHGYARGYGRYHPLQYQEATIGTLKLRVSPKTSAKAQVYIDDALASEFKHKKSLRLTLGEYQIQVRKQGYQSQSRTVYVTVGETLKLDFILVPAAGAAAQLPNSEMNPTNSKLLTAEGAPSNEPTGPMFLAMRLSPSGSRLAIAAWSTKGSAGSLHIYELRKGEMLALDRPSKTFQTEDEILALEWAPDEKSLAALTKPGLPVAESPRELVAGIRVLDLRTGEWTTVGTANLTGGSLEVSVLKTLSWSE